LHQFVERTLQSPADRHRATQGGIEIRQFFAADRADGVVIGAGFIDDHIGEVGNRFRQTGIDDRRRRRWRGRRRRRFGGRFGWGRCRDRGRGVRSRRRFRGWRWFGRLFGDDLGRRRFLG